ncbi:hypothetical protein [Crossiella cryophila]|uniref:Integrase n=1 Tax=Crossiella cryophila TaxID=43355 RepID=A0A7W7FWR1_9PSEU|nr:hypothetical protein [Crossiella cryophila]MBB4681756.1 hypothetical protein [Crossiella cryophila]
MIAFDAVDKPRSVIRWLSKSAGARLLSQIASEESEITHATLDKFPQTLHLNHVRQTLVHTGVLPERDEYLDRIDPWLDTLVSSHPEERAQLVRAYARWHVLRRARSRASRRTFTSDAGRRARTMIRVALEWLTWLDDIDRKLADVRQDEIDQWLTANPTRRGYMIDGFVAWAKGRRLMEGGTIPSYPKGEPACFLDDDQRWQQLKRCLDDDGVALTGRVAGALVLLFGQSPTRLIHLSAAHVEQQGEHTFLQLDERPVLLPPKLAKIVIKLRDTGRPSSVLGRAHPGTHWLFASVTPGRPLSIAGLRRRLDELGIRTRPARNAAMMALATDLPAAVLADLFGLHIVTAVRWVKYAKRDWAAYVAERATEANGNSAGSRAVDNPTVGSQQLRESRSTVPR